MKATAEHRLQSEIVQDFSIMYPKIAYFGLIMIKNDPRNVKEIQFYKAMGLTPGAGDLQLHYNSIVTVVEIKVEGHKYSRASVERQIEYGKYTVENGGNFIISTSKELILKFLAEAIEEKAGRTVIDIDKIILTGK